MCVRDHFVWNERRLCAWDYHATVFGKRGPWRDQPYEERYFDTLPRAAYVAPGLLLDLDVEPVLAVAGCPRIGCVSSSTSRSVMRKTAPTSRCALTKA
jgi:hypothetical protein